MSLSRRDFLRGIGAGAVLRFPRVQLTPEQRLLARIQQAVGDRHIGIAAARYLRGDDDTLQTVYRVSVNGDALRPTASCFKAWLPLYTFNFTPYEEWDNGPDTNLYKAVVYSNNGATGQVLYEMGQRQNFGNALEKFNDFTAYGLGMTHGLNSWNWPNNPLEGVFDPRYASGGERVVTVRGVGYPVSNVTTANDTLNGWAEMYRRSFAHEDTTYTDNPHRREAALRSLWLLSRAGTTDYNSPIERVLGRGVYIGKDGILPATDIATGRVVNDAGLIPQRNGMSALSFFSVGESEYSAMQILEQTLAAIDEAETQLAL